jgi:hypothetical protein
MAVKKIFFKVQHFFLKRKIFFYWTLVSLVCIFSFLFRFETFKYPHYLYQPDYSRDYIIGSHILEYGEFPTAAPRTTPLGTILGSPFYFYLIAFFLLLHNDMFFLGWINFFLQFFTLLILFYLAKELFGKIAALVTLVLFGFSRLVIDQSQVPWQPHIMQFFLILSLLLFFLAYKKKNYVYFITSIVLFILSAVIHVSVFGIFLLYAVLTMVLLKKTFSKKYYLPTVAIVFFVFFIVYFPKFFNTNSTITFANLRNTVTISHFGRNVHQRMEVFLRGFFYYFKDSADIIVYFAAFVLNVTFLIFLIIIRKIKSTILYSLIILFCLYQFLIAIAILPDDSFNSFAIRYFTPIFGLFCLFLGNVIATVFSRGKVLQLVQVVVVIILLQLVHPKLIKDISQEVAYFSSRDLVVKTMDYFSVVPQKNLAMEAIKENVIVLEKNNHMQDKHFFQIEEDLPYLGNYTPLFIAGLEREWQIKLSKVGSNDWWRDFDQISNKKYLFYICPQKGLFITYRDSCLKRFSKTYPSYQIEKDIFDSWEYKIYLAKNTQ